MSDETKQAAEQVPSAIGRYQITGTLGFGAMGAVYKAFDPLIKRTLAIKTIRLDIPRQSPQHQAFIERFYQEARISGTLSHPSIVTLFDIGEENGVPFLAMEFVDGKTIGTVLEEGTRFKPERVIGLVSQVAAALDYAHSRGVVHRDIKPSNLILHDEDKVKVTDFGIAKLADSEITHSGALLGTPSYMSPEQAMGEKLDGRSDIFSLGVVAFEMLSGQQPFPGVNVTSILYKLVHVDPIEPADLETNGLVPHKWREVFHKALAKRPEGRYQTAGAFVQDLEYCLGSWFTGLGSEETLSLQMPALEGKTATMPVPATTGVSDPGGAGEEPETLVLVSPAPAGSAATVVLTPSLEEPVAPTVRVPSPEASKTLPPTGEPRRMAPRPGVPAAWALGGVAAVATLALGIVGWALWQRPQTLEPPTGEADRAPVVAPEVSPSQPTVGTLRVETEPPGARVRVDGQVRGETPLVLPDLAFGAHEVRVEMRGYESQAREASLGPASPDAEVRVTLVRPAAPAQGGAEVVSTPPGAEVSVDGRLVGTTPLPGLKLKPGPHRIDVRLDGHEAWSETVEVTAGQTGRVEVRLRARPQAPATPTPEPVDAGRVYQNAAGEVEVLARKLSGSSPSYPSDRAGRLRSGERVSVVLRFVVTETGEVRDVAVVESGGKALDDVVVAAVRTWKYQPATRRGVPVKVHVMFKQTFLGG